MKRSCASEHWRSHDGDEVDLVVERADGTTVGLEVEAGAGWFPRAS
jgi:hypothetical protein